MSYTSGFFNAVETDGSYDRVYSAADFAHYFSLFIGNGVFASPATGLKVKQSSTADMNVTVSPGNGWINGYYLTVEDDNDPVVFTISAADSSLSRIDSVIMGLDISSRQIKLYVKEGALSSSPIASTLTRSDFLYELELAQIAVNKGVTAITESLITDKRSDSSRCGIVASLVDQIDTTDLFAQYDSAFNEWFTDAKNTLGTDTAGNLLERIQLLEQNTILETAEWTPSTILSKYLIDHTELIKCGNVATIYLYVDIPSRYDSSGGFHFELDPYNAQFNLLATLPKEFYPARGFYFDIDMVCQQKEGELIRLRFAVNTTGEVKFIAIHINSTTHGILYSTDGPIRSTITYIVQNDTADQLEAISKLIGG